MRYAGRITQWNDERGFGFIEPNGGGGPVFVHVSDLARRGRRPVIGDRVTYAVASGEADRPKAIEVAFVEKPVASLPGSSRGSRSLHRPRRRLRLGFTAVAMAVIAITAYSHRSYVAGIFHRTSHAPDEATVAVARFSCDGRTRCNQMTSCDEATFFIKHCPNTQMDGDRDGIPCEQQWCGAE